jgi:hypothetical protein
MWVSKEGVESMWVSKEGVERVAVMEKRKCHHKLTAFANSLTPLPPSKEGVESLWVSKEGVEVLWVSKVRVERLTGELR